MNNDLALFLGMLCGDGNLCIRTKKKGYKNYSVQFCNTDYKIVILFDELFIKIFNIKGNIHSQRRENRKEIFNFQSYSKEVFDKILGLGFPIGVKRDSLRVPEIIKNGSYEDKLYFLRGVFITDGSLKKGGWILFHLGSKVFLEDLSLLIYDIFGSQKKIKSYIQKERFISYQLSLNKEETKKLLLMPLSHNGSAMVLSLVDKMS